MSLRTGIARLHNITIDDVLRIISWLIPFAPIAISRLRSSWKDPFKRYRIVQAPIEFQVLFVPVAVGYIGQILSPGGVPVIFGPLSILAVLTMFSCLILDLIAKGRLLRRVREKWILPDPVIAFDCVHCDYMHGALDHSSHPPKKCKTCKSRWKDEWADYRKRPIPRVGEMYMDDFSPGATW